MAFSLSAQHITKRYGGVIALADGNIDVRSGEVVALLGANGSGKSTLSKIITGVVAPDEGQLQLNGQAVSFSSPQAAKRFNITAVYQELSLIPDMTVSENIWLTHEPLRFGFRIDRQQQRQQTADLIQLFAGTISDALMPQTPVKSLPPDERQIVEILKALSLKPDMMILDEATASLDSQQVNRLFSLIDEWKQAGMAIVVVSHRMDEIFRVADRATVLRNGSSVGHVNIADTNERQLVEMMIEGSTPAERIEQGTIQSNAKTYLSVRNLVTDKLRGIDLQLREGELMGIGGLQGQGQSDLLLALFGAIRFRGDIELDGQSVHFSHPTQAMRQRVAFVPGDRGNEGLLLIRSILDNLLLPSWGNYGVPLRMNSARQEAQTAAQDLGIVMAGLDEPVSSLSGGNAQKVVIGKWLLHEPRLLLLNDPTKGVDVGAKGEFYRLLSDLRQSGTAILFYSSDDEELLGLCDRILVMHDNQISAELSGEKLTRSNLVAASMGTPHHDA